MDSGRFGAEGGSTPHAFPLKGDAMESSVISRHWPASCEDIRPNGAIEGALRRAIRDLGELRTRARLTATADIRILSAIDALREAEEAERVRYR